MSDFGSDLKEDEVVAIRPPGDLPENDGWGDVEPPDASVDTDGSEISAIREDVLDDGLDREPATDLPELRGDDEVRSEVADDGWGETPEPMGTDNPEDLVSDVAAESSPEDSGREEDIEAARAEVAEAYEGEPKEMEFADIEYRMPNDSEGVGFESGHANQVIEVQMPDGEPGFLKPASGEYAGAAGRGDVIPDGTAWRREVATSQVDSMLGLGVVPETVAIYDPTVGEASLQENAPYEQFEARAEYEPEDLDRMAVLDYVAGNTDRHVDNYRSQIDGRPAAIDNGYCFPTGDNVPIKSDFVVDRLNVPLSPEVLSALNEVDLVEFREKLQECRIESDAIDGAVARLIEIRRDGEISGTSWDGEIRDGRGNVVRS